MKKLISHLSILLMLMLLGVSTTTFAGKIYKWTDSEGKVHYGERPPSSNAQQMRIPSAPSSTTPAPTPGNQSDAASKFLESVAAERKEQQEAADKMAKEKEFNDKNCSIAKRNVASLKQGGRRYEVDEQGERHYMDEAEIQKRLEEAQKDVAKWCK